MRATLRPLPALTPYVLVVIVHLVSIVIGASSLVAATKPLLMPALLVGVLLAMPARRSPAMLWLSLALACSWLGDVLLGDPGALGFLLGMVAFGLAHIAYIALYLGPARTRRVPPRALVFVIWYAALVGLLAPHLGSLLVPVLIYGLVLGAAAAVSLGSTTLVAIGAGVFLVSDTLLGLDRFLPGLGDLALDAAIMLTYCAGQGLIALGVVVLARARAAAAV